MKQTRCQLKSENKTFQNRRPGSLSMTLTMKRIRFVRQLGLPSDLTIPAEALFKNLDAAKLAPETILKSEAQKEHYETNVMFAFRKLQAAPYHCERVEALVAIQHQELCELHAGAEPEADTLKITSATMRISKSAQDFAFELSAFFAAIRSADRLLGQSLRTTSRRCRGDKYQDAVEARQEQDRADPGCDRGRHRMDRSRSRLSRPCRSSPGNSHDERRRDALEVW
jgi:hypothetical protein